MSDNLKELFELNRQWADNIKRIQPDFFSKLVAQQDPKYLWVGCSDSRVPANEIVGLLPGEMFVHRNVANVVVHTDLNCLSVVQYAVEVLQVEHIMVVGHYGCGGVRAALSDKPLGLIDNWLRHVQDVAEKHKTELNEIENQEERVNRLCELNATEQALNLCRTSIVQNAWRRGQNLTIHAWVYALQDGLLRDLNFHVGSLAELRDLG